MANVNKPFGLAPVRGFGGTWNEQASTYYIESGDTDPYYIGDMVISAATADAKGVPGVAKATANQTPRGIVVGVYPANWNPASLQGVALDLGATNVPATKTRAYYVMVVDDPQVVFMVQGDGTATNQTAAKASYNASLTIANGATSVSCSASVIDSSTINTTNSLIIKLMGLAQIPGNAIGAYAVYYAKFNLHELSAAGTTAI